GEFGAVFEEPLGQRVRALGEKDTGRWTEHCLFRPPRKRIRRAATGWIKTRARMSTLQLAHDQLTVAIDVGADLQNGPLAIAPRQRRQIGFRHDDGDLDRCPGEAFEAKAEPDFL